MDTTYFVEETASGLEDVCDREGRNPQERRTTLHFDDAAMHDTRTLKGGLEQEGFKRKEYPACGPDLAQCNFFLFGYMKEQLKGRSFAEEEGFYGCFLNFSAKFRLT
jgi:hypothetical protein